MYSGSSPQDSGAAGPRSRWPPPPRAGTRGRSNTRVRAPPPPRRPRTRTARARARRPRPAPHPTRAPARSGPTALPAAAVLLPSSAPSARQSVAPQPPPRPHLRGRCGREAPQTQRVSADLSFHAHLPGAGCPAARPPLLPATSGPTRVRLPASLLRPSQRSVPPPRTRAGPSGRGGAVEHAGGCSPSGPADCVGAGVCAFRDPTH